MLFEERRGHLVGQIVVRVNFRRPCDLQNNPCTQFVIRFLFHFSVFFDVRVDFEHGVVPLVGTSTAVQMLSQDLVIKSFDSRLFGARIGGIVTPIQVRKQDFYLVDGHSVLLRIGGGEHRFDERLGGCKRTRVEEHRRTGRFLLFERNSPAR